ncbi:MAG: hypothetical protein BWY45_02827 [Euryarchaeota archaeon ADurb.Bin294]|nr:MAG: hypothetical protein BWY45_02827 [Euryarchaeota archaeon ADurb.Bin294]
MVKQTLIYRMECDPISHVIILYVTDASGNYHSRWYFAYYERALDWLERRKKRYTGIIIDNIPEEYKTLDPWKYGYDALWNER